MAIANRTPGINKYLTTFPPGHFFSPIPSLHEVELQSFHLFNKKKDTIAGIDLRAQEQLKLIEKFKPFLKEFPFIAHSHQQGWQYSSGNGFFGLMDAMVLYGMMRSQQPRRIIEVGSGFSSALMVDVNKHFFENRIQFQFIDPFPERVRSLLDPDEQRKYIIPKMIQQVAFDELMELEAGDFLFIDSSHVSKTGSDLNYIVFEIIPKLKEGVIIHFHDIFYPFEYPQKWVKHWFKGFAWNEIYLVRALLIGSRMFEIVFFNSMMEEKYPGELQMAAGTVKEKFLGGGSLWLRKIA